uniref:Saposin B-type domain-containing protein n=1 Tax=Syphacia muris TaxID=451379 RepID=A0A0N5B0N9_9BILA
MLFKLCLLTVLAAIACAAPSTKIQIKDNVYVTVNVPAEKAADWECKACGVLYEVVMVAEDVASAPLTSALETACAALGPAAPVCVALVPFVVGAAETYGHKLTKNQLCKEIIKACK